MTKITNIGRNEHRIISDRVITALKTLESELGVKFKAQGGILGTGTGMIKLGVEVADTGAGASGKQIEFSRWAHLYGMKPEWFGKVFWNQGNAYKIVGISPSRPAYPMDIERVRDGKSLKASKDMVKRGIEAEIAKGRMV